MLLEFCAGGAIDSIMVELEKALTEPQIAYVARYMCEAVRYLHAHNVIHRDLKAGNVLLTADGQVKLGMMIFPHDFRDLNACIWFQLTSASPR